MSKIKIKPIPPDGVMTKVLDPPFVNYEVWSDGRILSLRTMDFVFERTLNSGYKAVVLWAYNKPKNFTVHRLVAQYFIEKPFRASVVNHKDDNKSNNDYRNLEWVTSSDNNYHSVAHQRHKGKKNHPYEILLPETGAIFLFPKLAPIWRYIGMEGQRRYIENALYEVLREEDGDYHPIPGTPWFIRVAIEYAVDEFNWIYSSM